MGLGLVVVMSAAAAAEINTHNPAQNRRIWSILETLAATTSSRTLRRAASARLAHAFCVCRYFLAFSNIFNFIASDRSSRTRRGLHAKPPGAWARRARRARGMANRHGNDAMRRSD